MPICIKISHLDRTVVGISEEVVTLNDIGGFLDAVVKAKARPYRKLFDATHGTSGLSDADLKALAARLHRAPAAPQAPLGPFAVVAGSNRNDLVSILRPFSSLERPMRLFKNIQSARKWLEDQKVVIG